MFLSFRCLNFYPTLSGFQGLRASFYDTVGVSTREIPSVHSRRSLVGSCCVRYLPGCCSMAAPRVFRQQPHPFEPCPHWMRREKRSKSGRVAPCCNNSSVHIAHVKQCITQQALEWDLAPFFRVASSVDGALRKTNLSRFYAARLKSGRPSESHNSLLSQIDLSLNEHGA